MSLLLLFTEAGTPPVTPSGTPGTAIPFSAIPDSAIPLSSIPPGAF